MSTINKFTVSKVKIIDLIMYSVTLFIDFQVLFLTQDIKDVAHDFLNAMCSMIYKILNSQKHF